MNWKRAFSIYKDQTTGLANESFSYDEFILVKYASSDYTYFSLYNTESKNKKYGIMLPGSGSGVINNVNFVNIKEPIVKHLDNAMKVAIAKHQKYYILADGRYVHHALLGNVPRLEWTDLKNRALKGNEDTLKCLEIYFNYEFSLEKI